AAVWRGLGFTQPVMVNGPLSEGETIPGTVTCEVDAILERADAFVFDFGSSARASDPNRFRALTSIERKWIGRQFLQVIRSEHARFDKKSPRRVVCLNAIHMPYEMMVRSHLGAGLTPFATRMRHGFALPPLIGKQDWTAALQVGAAAVRVGKSIQAKPDETGVICYGPYRWLYPGHYRLELGLSGTVADVSNAPVAIVELKWGQLGLDFKLTRPQDVRAGRLSIELSIDETVDISSALETVARTLEPTDLSITSLSCEQIERASAPVSTLVSGKDWLALLWMGPTARRDQDEKILIGTG